MKYFINNQKIVKVVEIIISEIIEYIQTDAWKMYGQDLGKDFRNEFTTNDTGKVRLNLSEMMSNMTKVVDATYSNDVEIDISCG